MHLDDQETAFIEQSKHVINEPIHLASVKLEQPFIEAAISSPVTCDGAKSKFESWIMNVKTVAQILGKTCYA